MVALWFVLLAWMLATYVVLAGFELGAGSLHLLVARTEAERRQVLATVKPVWKGNEVWLVAAGGTLFLAFPKLLATAFSGFYLPLMLVLWLIVFRSLAIELRAQLGEGLWRQFWDVCWSVSSLLLVLFFGAALGNVVRGVPLGEDGLFFEPLWTDFRVGEKTGVLDWYTIVVGLTAVVGVAHHGALWLAARTTGAVAERADALAGRLWPAVVAAVLASSVASFTVQPQVERSLAERPWGVGVALLAAGGLLGAALLRRRGRALPALVASCVFLAGLMGCAALGVWPYVLPARVEGLGLLATDAASRADGLVTALAWWLPGMALATGYAVYHHRKLGAPVPLPEVDAPEA